ncbi:MAG TPA: hypothetical protein VNO13_09400 [Candidatus Udaeobacter sp.]|nr:hypothetical protein [Candidatus Udaeobacter sp.]
MASFCPQVRSAQVLLAPQSSGVPATAASSGERPNADPREFFVVDAVLILYYFVVYTLLTSRRDSAAVVIHYSPPANFSPAQLRFLLTCDSDRKTVAAVVLSLAARGLVTIKCLDNFYLITKRVDTPPPGLPAEEDLAFRIMFGLAPAADLPVPNPWVDPAVPKGSYLLHPIAGEGFAALLRGIDKALRLGYERQLFKRHLIFSVPAAALSIYFLCATTKAFPYSAILSATFLAGVLFANFTPYMRDAFHGRTSPKRKGTMTVIIFMYICYVGLVSGLSQQYPNTFLFTIFLAIFVNVWFPIKLCSVTVEGRRLLHELKGYKFFLSTVEVDRLQSVIGDNWTPSQTTTNLAYSIAFDLHGAWEDYLAQSDFHSVYWGPSKTKPALNELPIHNASSSINASFRRYLIHSCVLCVLVVIANGLARSTAEFMFYLLIFAGIARLAQYVYAANQAKQ